MLTNALLDKLEIIKNRGKAIEEYMLSENEIERKAESLLQIRPLLD